MELEIPDSNRLLTERELYQIVLPTPLLLSVKSVDTTISASRKVPNISVLSWDDFLAEAFKKSSSLDANNSIYKRPDFSTSMNFLSVEDSVTDMFIDTMNSINNRRLIHLQSPENWGKRYLFKGVKGQPELIRCSADSMDQLKKGDASRILAIIEIKPEQLINELLPDGGLDLHAAYNKAITSSDDMYTQHERIIKMVRQTFGYMVVNDLRYGILTTYIRTWFFQRDRDNPNIIYISPAVRINQNHTPTHASFLECMYYHETLSTDDSTAHSSPPTDSDYNDDAEDGNDEGNDGNDECDDNNSNDEDDDDDGNNEGDSSYKSSKRKWVTLNITTQSMEKKPKTQNDNESENLEDMKNYDYNQFSFGDMLGNGRTGAVFAAKLCGKTGALKMTDLYKNEYLLQETLNEIKMYLGPLRDIQYMYTPKLLKFGVLHEAFIFILTSLCGKSFAKLDDVTEREKHLAIEGLQAIHARGVMHGDVRLENIMINRSESTSKSRVRWIDFGWSKMSRSSKNFNRELTELRRLLGMAGHGNPKK
ncbi:hypothetical protein RclHR1_26110001 [Rhizophagus clarus]|uniref:Kinase-like domain-containing protein n=1 Tax=Rhizophagus clarus TaxID=94130 RepID=A0A2Z6RCV4_9GLOM|nr:hypothetical protein RclHR1_26110001 [Rhizophagus clarus]GES83003.1 kinase-like domain-containing protein [Rhizophagus clarus]